MAASLNFSYPPELAKYTKNKEELLKDYQGISAVCCGGFIFKSGVNDINNDENKDNNHNAPLKLLCIKRAATDVFPHFWEVPGGAMESDDESLLHAVSREVLEETGLTVTNITSFVDTEDFWGSNKIRRWRKFNFICKVTALEPIVLDPLEHSEYRWLTMEEIRDGIFDGEDEYTIGRAFEAQKRSIMNAFALMRNEIAEQSAVEVLN